MTRKERLRRVVLVCLHCTRNLAYYRVGRREQDVRSQFWLTVNGNCLDQCVLEWCKLFGKKDLHSWKKFVTNPAEFEVRLLCELRSDSECFQEYVKEMHRYRDRWVAHLDSEMTMDLPKLDIAKASTAFYHSYVVTQEAQPDDLRSPEHSVDLSLYVDPTHYYDDCEAQATAVYKSAIVGT